MWQIDAPHTVATLTERFKVACDLNRPIDRGVILDRVRLWIERLSPKSALTFRFAESSGDFLKIARAARDARDAWDARDARDAWDAWDAWDARDARDAWDARAARAAWDARDARDASWDCSWVSITAIGALSRSDREVFETWYPLFEAFEAGCFCFWITDSEVVIAERPHKVGVDDRRRLHSETGPAFSWLSDVRDYYWHGVFVSEYIVDRPQEITAAKIEAEPNVEVRRVMIDRFPGGQSAYLLASGAEEIQRDDFGVLYRKNIKDDEPIVMVKVINSTAEPDGSFKDYFLRVDPQLRPLPDGVWTQEEKIAWMADQKAQKMTAKNAVASTWGKRGEEYAPLVET